MAKVQDVANYFLSLADVEAGDLLSNLKLQKLCYYAQGFSLALTGESLFEDPIEAWTHGPVVPNLYHQFKHYKSEAIPCPKDFNSEVLNEDVRSLLDEVFEVYGQYSAWKLRNMTHDEAPWVEAFKRGPNTVITDDAMRSFFRTMVN